MRRHLIWLAALVALSTTAYADTLLLTSGGRVEGTLIAVEGNEIAFEERTGFLRRVVRYSRDQVRSIELGEPRDAANNRATRADRAERPAGPPRGLRERSVQVRADAPWSDTGIDVREGQMVYFVASGDVRWGPRRKDGAAGERNSPFNAARPIPDRPAAALIGRIGEVEDPFFIGADREPFRMRGAGRLYLGINDEGLHDNSGFLTVKVLY